MGSASQALGAASPRVAVLVLGSIASLALFGYLAAGLIYGSVLLDNAQTALAMAVDDQKSLAPEINSLKHIGTTDPATTEAEVRKDRAALVKLVAGVETSRAQVESDDESLANVGASLDQDRWLTLLSRSSLDRAATRLNLERNVLSDARTIVGGTAQVGEFGISVTDVLLDFLTISAAAQARDSDAIERAIDTLQADTARAISLDKAPGLPPEVEQTMQQLQTIDNDFLALFKAGMAHNKSAIDAANAAGWADIARLNAIDNSKVSAEIAAFYSPLIDVYNGDVARAAAA